METDSAPSEQATIAYILSRYRTIAVVGLSPKPHRDSFEVARYLQAQGLHVIPINPNSQSILGEIVYPNLQAASRHHTIELVNVFRNSLEVPSIVADAIAIGAHAVWLQIGVCHPTAAQAREAGLKVVQNKCLMVEHRQYCLRH